jgi:hypothetical protein
MVINNHPGLNGEGALVHRVEVLLPQVEYCLGELYFSPVYLAVKRVAVG